MDRENNTTNVNNGTTPAQLIPFPVPAERHQQPKSVGSDCGTRVLLSYGVADLISAILSHPDTPDLLRRALYETIIGADVDHNSPAYVSLALAALSEDEPEM